MQIEKWRAWQNHPFVILQFSIFDRRFAPRVNDTRLRLAAKHAMLHCA
jgi:hypothetical protein